MGGVGTCLFRDDFERPKKAAAEETGLFPPFSRTLWTLARLQGGEMSVAPLLTFVRGHAQTTLPYAKKLLEICVLHSHIKIGKNLRHFPRRWQFESKGEEGQKTVWSEEAGKWRKKTF